MTGKKASQIIALTIPALLVAVTLLALCFIQPATPVSAADDKAQIERALINALPKNSDMPYDVTWKSTDPEVHWGPLPMGGLLLEDVKPEEVIISKEFGYIESCLIYSAITYVKYGSNPSPTLSTAEAFRSFIASKFTITPQQTLKNINIQGGVLAERKTPGHSAIDHMFMVFFWKSPYCYGFLNIFWNATPRDINNRDVTYDSPCYKNADLKAMQFDSSGPERLAQFIWNRLPNGKVGIVTPPDKRFPDPPPPPPDIIIEPKPDPPSPPQLPHELLPIVMGVTTIPVILGLLSILQAQGYSYGEAIEIIRNFFQGKGTLPGQSQPVPADPAAYDQMLKDQQSKDLQNQLEKARDELDRKQQKIEEFRKAGQSPQADAESATLDELERDIARKENQLSEFGGKEIEHTTEEHTFDIRKDYGKEEREKIEAEYARDLEDREKIQRKRDEVDAQSLQAKHDERAIDLSYRDGIKMTSREVFTGLKPKLDKYGQPVIGPDGKPVYETSVKSMLLRPLADVATGGTSEYVYNAADAGYRISDRIDKGETVLEAITNTSTEMGTEHVLFKRGPRWINRMGAKNISKPRSGFRNPGKTTKKIVEDAKATVVKKITTRGKFISHQTKQEIAEEAQKKSLELAEKTIKKSGENFITTTFKPKAVAQPAGEIPQPTASKNLSQESEETVKDLFASKTARDKLVMAEKRGELSTEDVKVIYKVQDKEVAKADEQATKDAASLLQHKLNVRKGPAKLKTVFVGDSGSSAKPGAARWLKGSDYDKTHKLEFTYDEAKLQEHAKRYYEGNVEAARKALEKKHMKEFLEAKDRSFRGNLKSQGINPDGIKKEYFNGFGENAGPDDSYRKGFSTVRQAVQGKTTIHQVNEHGNSKVIHTSGEQMLEPDSKFGHTDEERLLEAKSLVQKQLEVVDEYGNDIGKLAKALGRCDKAAELALAKRPDSEVMKICKKIDIYKQDAVNEMTGEEKRIFIKQAKEIIRRSEEEIDGIREIKKPWLQR